MEKDDIQKWITTENGTHIPIRRGQTKSEAVNAFFNQDDDYKYPQYLARMNGHEGRQDEETRKEKMTPAEKIASVHIDFDRDNVLPELNEEDLQKIGADKNKPVLLKKEVIDRNAIRHYDLTDSDFQGIIGQALYQPSEIFPANKEKPYFHFAKIIEENSKGKSEYGLVILDVDNNKDNFEVVHVQFMRKRSYDSLKKRK